jgi:hypothetical protein
VIDRSTTRDTPIDPMASFEGRNVVWNPCRGNHLGQRSCASAPTGRTYGRKRSDQNAAQILARRGPSTYGSAPTTSAGMRRRPSNPTHTSLPSCSRPSRTNPPGGPGRKNGSAGGRTKEWHETGGQNDFKSDILIPSSHPSTKPGQVHAVAYRSIATHAPISRCAITTRHYCGHGNASARARATRPGAAKCRCSG